MAVYTLADEEIMRRNGPDNAVRSLKEPTATYKRVGRKWVGNGKEYQNFAALLSERSWGVEDIPVDPYEEAINYFTSGRLTRGALYGDEAKDHALVIIKRAIPQKPKPYTSPPW